MSSLATGSDGHAGPKPRLHPCFMFGRYEMQKVMQRVGGCLGSVEKIAGVYEPRGVLSLVRFVYEAPRNEGRQLKTIEGRQNGIRTQHDGANVPSERSVVSWCARFQCVERRTRLSEKPISEVNNSLITDQQLNVPARFAGEPRRQPFRKRTCWGAGESHPCAPYPLHRLTARSRPRARRVNRADVGFALTRRLDSARTVIMGPTTILP